MKQLPCQLPGCLVSGLQLSLWLGRLCCRCSRSCIKLQGLSPPSKDDESGGPHVCTWRILFGDASDAACGCQLSTMALPPHSSSSGICWDSLVLCSYILAWCWASCHSSLECLGIDEHCERIVTGPWLNTHLPSVCGDRGCRVLYDVSAASTPQWQRVSDV